MKVMPQNKEKQDELLSIIMSTYNETKNELEDSIESILNQSYKNFEFIIVNDNPENKDLKSILLQYRDKRIKLIENEKNLGLVASLNRAIKLCKGNIIVRQDADDISEKNRLQKQLYFMKKNNCDFCGCYANIINENTNFIAQDIITPRYKYIEKATKFGTSVIHPTWMVRKEVYQKLNGYRDIKYCEDYDFLIRAIKSKFKIDNLPEKLLQYRIRTESISHANIEKQYILRIYLSKNRNKQLSESEINTYMRSDKYKKECNKYKDYLKQKQLTKHKTIIYNVMRLITTKYFYYDMIEKIMNKYYCIKSQWVNNEI